MASLLAGFAQGTAGFGFALVLTPLLLLLGGIRPAVFTSLALGLPLSAAVVWQTRCRLTRRTLLPLLFAAALATPVGFWLLATMSPLTLREVAVAVAFVGAILLLLYRPRPLATAASGRLLVAAGLLGGLLNGATGMGGPPAALLVAAEGRSLQEARGLLSAFNLVSYAFTSGALLLAHRVSDSVVGEALIWLPFAVLGMGLGSAVARIAPTAAYPKIAALTAAGAATLALLVFFLP